MIQSVLNETVTDSIQSPYIQNLLMYQIKNASRYIYFDYDILLEDYKFLHQIIKKNGPDDLFHIDRLCKIFPNCHQMVFTMTAACEQRETFWTSVCSDTLRVDRAVTVSFEWIDGPRISGRGMALLSWESQAVKYCRNRCNELQMKFMDKIGMISISRSRSRAETGNVMSNEFLLHGSDDLSTSSQSGNGDHESHARVPGKRDKKRNHGNEEKNTNRELFFSAHTPRRTFPTNCLCVCLRTFRSKFSSYLLVIFLVFLDLITDLIALQQWNPHWTRDLPTLLLWLLSIYAHSAFLAFDHVCTSLFSFAISMLRMIIHILAIIELSRDFWIWLSLCFCLISVVTIMIAFQKYSL